jgi:hypothetical protein
LLRSKKLAKKHFLLFGSHKISLIFHIIPNNYKQKLSFMKTYLKSENVLSIWEPKMEKQTQNFKILAKN